MLKLINILNIDKCDNNFRFVLYVNGEKVITDDRMNDGYWHFVCVSWEKKLGSWQYYVDGDLKDNGTSLAKDTEIEGNLNRNE